MKCLFLLLLLSVPVFSFASDPEYIDLPLAVRHKTVEIRVEAAGSLGSSDNLRCILKNRTGKEVKLRIPPGLHFESKDPGAQDLFTVKEILVVISPLSEKVVMLQGYCMQIHNYGPSSGDIYFFKGYAQLPLKVLGDSLHKYTPLATYYGQMFVWAFTDNRSMYPISVDSTLLEGATNVMRYVALQTSQPFVSVGVQKPVKSGEFIPSVSIFSKKGILVFHNPVNQKASFKLYNSAGEEQYVFFENRELGHGIKHYTFGVNELLGPRDEPAFFVKVINQQGAVLAEMKVDKDTEAREVEPVKLQFPFEFELKKGVQYVKLNVYLEDGSPVEEFHRYKQLDFGKYNLVVDFLHLHPAGTKFIARLEDVKGTIYHQQVIGAQ